jgi:hypothetical protein
MKKEHDSENLKKETIYIHSLRGWKEYIGESALIIFSVLLALFLTEAVNKAHDRRNTKEELNNIVIELKNNKKALLEMQIYNSKVLEKIESALKNRIIQDSLVSNNEFHLNVIAPEGVLYRYLEDDAWTVAKSNNIISKVDIKSISILNRIYEDQQRIGKVENEVARVIFERNARDPKQVLTTLILIRDIYHGWAVDRVPGLLSRMDTAIKMLEKDQKLRLSPV